MRGGGGETGFAWTVLQAAAAHRAGLACESSDGRPAATRTPSPPSAAPAAADSDSGGRPGSPSGKYGFVPADAAAAAAAAGSGAMLPAVRR